MGIMGFLSKLDRILDFPRLPTMISKGMRRALPVTILINEGSIQL